MAYQQSLQIDREKVNVDLREILVDLSIFVRHMCSFCARPHTFWEIYSLWPKYIREIVFHNLLDILGVTVGSNQFSCGYE